MAFELRQQPQHQLGKVLVYVLGSGMGRVCLLSQVLVTLPKTRKYTNFPRVCSQLAVLQTTWLASPADYRMFPECSSLNVEHAELSCGLPWSLAVLSGWDVRLHI